MTRCWWLTGLLSLVPLASQTSVPTPAVPVPAPAAPGSVRALIDFEGLARLEPGVTCRQLASTDPTGRGHDHGHFLRQDGDRFVLADLTGPGVIARIWSANPAGRLTITFDGEATPRIDCPFQDLFTGKQPPFAPPVAVSRSGGWISYFPIPYAKSAKVELRELPDPGALYWQIQYVTYPPGTAVPTFVREPGAEETRALAEVLTKWSQPGPFLNGILPGDKTHGGNGVVGAGKSLVLADVAGPGLVMGLMLTPERTDPATLRGVVLEAFQDGATEPSVCVPVADFFGMGFGLTPYRGLALGWTESGGYSNLVMPARDRLVLALRNTTDRELPVNWSVQWRARAVTGLGFLHAELRAVDGVGAELYELASIEGRGKYVGVCQALQGVGDLWYLEGNERFFVDGETRPSIDGTGTEDFYNGGWYWNEGTFALPLHGLGVKAEWTTNRTTPWRFQLLDAVPFERSLRVQLEHGSANQVRDAYYSSVVFSYRERPQRVRALAPGDLVVPRIWMVRPKGFTCAAELEWSGPAAKKTWEELTTTHRGLDRPLFQAFPVSYVEHGKPSFDSRVLVLPRNDAAPESFVATVQVPHADRWRLRLRVVGDPAGGTLLARVDDAPVTSLALKGDPLPFRAFDLPAVGLEAGAHRITLTVPRGAGVVRVHALRLESAAELVRAWQVGPPVPSPRGATVEDPVELEPRLVAATFDPAAAGWKKVEQEGEHLKLAELVSRDAPMLGYLLTYVHSPAARMARAMLGSDDGVRVWVNGSLCWSKAVHRHFTPDEDQFDLPLDAGWNRVLVKVRNDDGGYALGLRIADPDGGLRFAAEAK